VVVDYEAPITFYRGRGDSTTEEKWSTVSRVFQFFRFAEKRGRGSTYFGRGNEHARQVTRGCSGGQQAESGDIWIDLRWKTTSHDERLVSNLPRGRGRSIGGDLNVGEGGSEQMIVTLQSLHHGSVGYQHVHT
jgi:hypothetical protein